ncbi:NTP transferase domain-containing protein [Candidatus Poribacteria bacterium]|nr:NTP transferase domain-containing protein [Candidatus Poribacteria bacterium]
MGVKKAVIPAAGLGTRMLPATKSQPKEMLPVGRKPVIQYVMEELEAAGIDQILIITGQKKRAIEDHFDRDSELIRNLEEKGKHDLLCTLDYENCGVKLFYTRQGIQLGTAHAISLAESFVDNEPFVVCLGDSIIKSKEPGSFLKKLIETHEKREASVTIAFQEVAAEDVIKYGIADPFPEHSDNSDFRLRGLVEKPEVDEAPSRMAISARYVFSPRIFKAIEETPMKNGEYQITDSIKILMETSEVWGHRLGPDEKRYDVGGFKSYFETFLTFALEDEEYGKDLGEYIKRFVG